MLGKNKLKSDDEPKFNFTWLSDKFTLGKKIGICYLLSQWFIN